MSKVSLSKNTLDVLKNFSSINSSIVFREGSTVRTISNAENILAKFTGEEFFPTDFAIYDLSQFLGGLSLFKVVFSSFGKVYLSVLLSCSHDLMLEPLGASG